MVLDRAFDQEPAMIAHLEERLGAKVQGVTVQRVDHVNDATWVEVRFQLPKTADAVAARPAAGPRSTPLPRPSRGRRSTPQPPAATATCAAGPTDERAGHRDRVGVMPYALPAIGLDELVERSELQTRIDRKYVVDPAEADVRARPGPGRDPRPGHRRGAHLRLHLGLPRHPRAARLPPGAHRRRRRFKVRSRCDHGQRPGLPRGQDPRRRPHREDPARGPARAW